jgi:excisionase family DNA binding protein
LDGTRVVVEMPDNLGRLLTTEQAAEVLAVSVRTVKNLFSEGALAYVKIGRATRVDLSDVEQYIVRNRRKQRRSLRRVN